MCCLVQDRDEGKVYLLTCNHVLTEGLLKDFSDKELREAQVAVTFKLQNQSLTGTWVRKLSE